MRSHPRSEDVLLVIEVADSSLDFDLHRKIPIYARNGIDKAWVVNLPGRCVHAFRDPAANGYRTAFTASGEASLSPPALPDIDIALTTLIPTAA
ncbi:MAG: Uma2 family endonuclease [Burkholderiales bacterium]